jgi:3-methyladenine DNA glycosylase AlkD
MKRVGLRRGYVKAKAADELAERVSSAIQTKQPTQAYALLEPILAERTPFRTLDRIGERIGTNPFDVLGPFLDLVSQAGTMGGWVIIGSALKIHLNQNLEETFERCRTMIIHADTWYGADILGERVPGPALVTHFKPALKALTPWQQDPNRWVRRSVGVSVHFWAKRSRGSADLVPRAAALLAFLEPMFEEWETDAIKGVGWGLKTLGKHYPDQLADWLEVQINQQQRRHRRLILKKALTYLPERHKARFLKEPSR